MAVQLSSTSSVLLPPTITGPIFAKASEQSAVQQLAQKASLPTCEHTKETMLSLG